MNNMIRLQQNTLLVLLRKINCILKPSCSSTWGDRSIKAICQKNYKSVENAFAIVEPEYYILDRRDEEVLSDLMLQALNDIEDVIIIEYRHHSNITKNY